MRKIMTLAGMLCLACLATILAVLIASQTLIQIKRTITPEAQPAPMMVSQRATPTQRVSVFEALVDRSYEIFIADALTGQTRQLTYQFGNDRFPVLSPDGRQVAFVSWQGSNSEIYIIDLATGVLRNVSRHPAVDILPVWSPDGTMLTFGSQWKGNAEIYVADVARGLVQNLTHSPGYNGQPKWLPDSHWLVFVSNRSGVQQQYLTDIGGRNPTVYQPAELSVADSAKPG